jgi:hypothetical protein
MSKPNRANKNGSNLESIVEAVLKRQGYSQIEPQQFATYAINEKLGYYSNQVSLGSGIYGTGIRADFVVMPRSRKEPIIIECKWQQTLGTADEKLPFLVANIREHYPYPTCIVIDGSGFREGALRWLRRQKDHKIFGVYSLSEFQTWANDGGLQ